MIDLTVIIPAYNEELAIEKTVERLKEHTAKLNWKIIVVNDGSKDRTGEIIDQIKGIQAIHHPINKGYGAALKTGIRASTTEYISMYDADNQHNPEDLINLSENIENNDMIVGQRGKDSHQDWIRKPGKWVLGKVANFLTGTKIPDLNSGLRIIKKETIIDKLSLFSDAFSFSTTSTVAFLSMGYAVKYYPIKVNKRIGVSSVRQFKHGSDTIMLILRLIVLFNPLKVFLPISFWLFAIGFVYEIIWGLYLSVPMKILPGAIIVFISGILIFSLGLLADQISAIRKSLLH